METYSSLCFNAHVFSSPQGWLRLGLSRRATAASAMNDKSSRSHCIFSVTLVQNGGTKRSKVNLVDLAGSERLVNTSATGDRLRVSFYRERQHQVIIIRFGRVPSLQPVIGHGSKICLNNYF